MYCASIYHTYNVGTFYMQSEKECSAKVQFDSQPPVAEIHCDMQQRFCRRALRTSNTIWLKLQLIMNHFATSLTENLLRF